MSNSRLYIWGLIGQFLPQALQLITYMILARLLSPVEFGQIGVLAIFIAIANTLVDIGLGGSLIKEKEITKDDKATVFTFNLFVSLSIYICLFLSAEYIEKFYNSQGLLDVVRLLSLIFVINAFGIVPKALMHRELRFKTSSTIVIISVFIASITAVCCAVLGMGVYSLVIQQLLQTLFIVIGFYACTRYKIKIRWKYSSFKKLVPFGLYTTFANIVDTAYENILPMFTGRFMGVKESGFLSQAQKLEKIPTETLSNTINTVSFPILSAISDNKNLFLGKTLNLIRVIALMLFPVLIIISTYSLPIVLVLFGKQWIHSASYLSYLIYAGIFVIMDTQMRNYIKSLGRAKSLFQITIIKRVVCVIILILTVLLSSKWLLYGYITCSVLSFLFSSFMFAHLVQISFMKLLMNIMKLLMPSFVYVLTVSLLGLGGEEIKFIYTVIFAIVYYFFILPKYGCSIVSLMTNFIRRR